MKKLILALIAVFAFSSVALAEEPTTTDTPDNSAPTVHHAPAPKAAHTTKKAKSKKVTAKAKQKPVEPTEMPKDAAPAEQSAGN